MFCVRTIGMMWCVPIDRNAQDVPIQCHADELMCMIWCAMSFTFEPSGYPQVNLCMHHVLQWDWWTTPVKDVIKNHLHHVVRMRSCAWCIMMWCVGSQSSVSQLTFCSMILSGYKALLKKGSAPRCSYEIMRINKCVIEHRIVQRVNQLFYITHVALILFVLLYCAILYT